MEQSQILGLATMDNESLTLKQVLKRSNIHLRAATIQLRQGNDIYIDLPFAESEFTDMFRKASNTMFWKLRGKIIRLDKSVPVELHLTLKSGENEFRYKVEKEVRRDATGKALPFNDKSIGTLLKDLLKVFGASYMIARTEAGHYDNFTHAANNLSNFVKIDRPTLPSPKKHKPAEE